ncbi:putative rna binding protein [Lasiodiplodia theobromae]|uniref:Nucleolar protein 13 n=1 Tax=Lasiodiplodia theobromae TaxID=45133 RepID=A0A5N5D3E2_9PEZI|nr:Nucleolar protein 13 [Lasiodiplodia theobromae]KAB2572208.1 Nucleolar protein 13 [Lasiodiplodia theobromae]KAF4541126.1 Nucleolar protein 13 [Lasiodiplodia theobromae]KAF9632340.1 putative rna binding protein [Lasiodiplodia theobromae]
MTSTEISKKEKKEKKDKKEKKEKKSKKSKTESETPADEPTTAASAEETPKPAKDTSSKKRKRSALPEDGELEVDITAPEPLSKREQRLAKKGKLDPATKTLKAPKPAAESDSDESDKEEGEGATKQKKKKEKKEKSPHGIWIGNLPWSATRDSIREFFAKHAGLTGERITRIHMPLPDKAAIANMRFKPHNKGFAYVDFDNAAAVQAAIEASETLMSGRAVLIKDASNFEGRPQQKEGEGETEDGFKKFSKTAAVQAGGGKEPNKRVFVGNLSFDVTKESLIAHYSKCGEIADVFMATFQDTGKCKGYAWVTFETLDAAAAAVAGYTMIPADDDSDEEMEDAENEDADGAGEKKKKKKKKARKWFVNRMEGRELRVEYAEDASTRYRKRFGKEKEAGHGGARDEQFGEVDAPKQHTKSRKEPRKVDARNIRSGAALANAPRASAAIVEAQGKKITFD